MAIEKNLFKGSRIDLEYSPRSRGSMSSDDDEFHRRSSAIESDEDDFDDADSGAGSDDFDLLELGETGAEFCQIGNQSCAVPFELYDLPNLHGILSLDAWNDCLTEEERFSLAGYLPDMDHFSFLLTLKELLSGCNFHFGSPITKLFDMLKSGCCEPRVALYRQALDYFQRLQHYHLLRVRQDNMVANLCQMRDAWKNCKGYSIEERLQVLNIMRSQKSLMYENMEDLGMDSGGSSERMTPGKGSWNKLAKDKRIAQKSGSRTAFEASPKLDFHSGEKWAALEPVHSGKKNPKGLLKLAGPRPSLMMKSGSCNSIPSLHQKNKATGYESRPRNRIENYDVPETEMSEVPVNNTSRHSTALKSGVLKLVGKKHKRSRGDDFPSDSSIMGFPSTSKDVLAPSERKPNASMALEMSSLTVKKSDSHRPYAKKIKCHENFQHSAGDDHLLSSQGQAQHTSLQCNGAELSDGAEPFWHGSMQGQTSFTGPSFETSSLQTNDRLFDPDYRTKALDGKITGSSRYSGEPDRGGPKGIEMYDRNEETESGSSEPNGDEEDNLLVRRKLGHPNRLLESHWPSFTKSSAGTKKSKAGDIEHKVNARVSDGNPLFSRRLGGRGEHVHMPESGNPIFRAKKKGKMRESGFSHNSSLNDGDGKGHKFGKKNGQVHGVARKNTQSYFAERGQRGFASDDYALHKLNQFHDNPVDGEDVSLEMHPLADGVRTNCRLDTMGQSTEAYENDFIERCDVTLNGCNPETRKQKWKDDVAYMDDVDEYDDLQSNSQLQIGTSNPSLTEIGATDELEIKPQKKTFTLITPTVHTGFTFSIIHLLSAVRIAMITPHLEDAPNIGNHSEKYDGMHMLKEAPNGFHYEDMNTNTGPSERVELPSLTVQEIVNRVWLNPGDPCILETPEPLQDLVRGVLKIFSSKTAPLGAKGWKALVLFEKTTKSWSWIGPVSPSTLDQETIEEVTAPESWGLPQRMLVKLVDSFANWLKSSQETLQQIGSLPAPPGVLMQFNLDEKERFKDLRAQKSLTTICPSSEEVRVYFQKEEFLRYSVPDRAFSYTAADGRKSIVAPLRRCGGKPTSKARDHFMLKRDRPPHVTILCLVRDAASRLPGSIGTRADVCTLIRDSQYIVEDISDAQVNQVVSGALDRLHYERDPCVQFDGERKLWVYLHRDREEEDFEDDGTSSTKKWKRPKKDALEQFDQGTARAAYDGAGERMDGGSAAGFDLSSNLNVGPLGMDEDNQVDFLYDAERQPVVEENGEYVLGAEPGNSQQCNPMVWETLGFNTLQNRNSLCQENSTNVDFCDEAGKPVGFFGSALS